jgi:hypothetical protein
MKKIFVLLPIIFMLLIPISVVATETVNKENDGIETLKENIISTVADIVVVQGYNDDPGKIEVRFDKVEKIYIDTGIETLKQKDLENIITLLSESDYVYVVPVYTENHFFTVTLAKGFGNGARESRDILTEEEINYLEEYEDKWHITEILEPEVNDYYDTIKEIENNTGFYNIFLIGGMPGIRMPIAIVCDEEKIVGIADLGYSRMRLEELTLGSETPLAFSEGASILYDYDAVVKGVYEYKNALSGDPLSEGTGGIESKETVAYPAIYISIISLMIVAVVAIVAIINRLKRNSF